VRYLLRLLLLTASVAVPVSTTGALKMLAATATESVAVPASETALTNICWLLTASVAVAVSETDENCTPAKDANGASAKAEIPNTLPRQTHRISYV
jgi:hypothetical protein